MNAYVKYVALAVVTVAWTAFQHYVGVTQVVLPDAAWLHGLVEAVVSALPGAVLGVLLPHSNSNPAAK